MGSVGNNANPNFGEPGVYTAFRSGAVDFNSPLGYLSFGGKAVQSWEYQKLNNDGIHEYNLRIKNPLYIEGTDFNEMQEELARRFVGRSYEEGGTLEEKRAIMKSAAEKMEQAGYDVIMMKKYNRLKPGWGDEYEFGVLNGKRNSVIRKKRKKGN